MTDQTPELRASDADRERTADVLRQAAGEGRLTVDELDERLGDAYGARTRGELERLVADVVVPGEELHPAYERLPVRPGEGGTQRLISVMSGKDRKGRWRVAPRCTVVNVMGGSDLDFTQAELASGHTRLKVISIMGGADIRVPEGLNVEVSDFALMGGNRVDVGNATPDPGGPVLSIRLVSIMGGNDVQRGPKRSLRERLRERRLERL